MAEKSKGNLRRLLMDPSERKAGIILLAMVFAGLFAIWHLGRP